jgi:hypothetical protein
MYCADLTISHAARAECSLNPKSIYEFEQLANNFPVQKEKARNRKLLSRHYAWTLV